jgi:hypothetical protein
LRGRAGSFQELLSFCRCDREPRGRDDRAALVLSRRGSLAGRFIPAPAIPLSWAYGPQVAPRAIRTRLAALLASGELAHDAAGQEPFRPQSCGTITDIETYAATTLGEADLVKYAGAE